MKNGIKNAFKSKILLVIEKCIVIATGKEGSIGISSCIIK